MEKSAVISELETIFRDYFDDPDLELTPETSQELKTFGKITDAILSMAG